MLLITGLVFYFLLFSTIAEMRSSEDGAAQVHNCAQVT